MWIKGGGVMRRIGAAVLAVTGVLACPCHLVVTLPLLAGMVAGTALGSFLTNHASLVYLVAGIYFVGALALSYWFWVSPNRPKRQGDATCAACAPATSDERPQEPRPMQEDLPVTRR
jgi:mercuric ion transport protein